MMEMADAFEMIQHGGSEKKEGMSLFDYLEAAYGTERAESLTIGVWKDLQKAGGLAFKIMEDEVNAEVGSKNYERANQIESLIDKIEDDVIGERDEST